MTHNLRIRAQDKHGSGVIDRMFQHALPAAELAANKDGALAKILAVLHPDAAVFQLWHEGQVVARGVVEAYAVSSADRPKDVGALAMSLSPLGLAELMSALEHLADIETRELDAVTAKPFDGPAHAKAERELDEARDQVIRCARRLALELVMA